MDECSQRTDGVTHRSQGAGDRRFYYFDLALRAVDAWEPNADYPANALVRPTEGQETGWLYTQGVTSALSGPLEPIWPSPGGSTVTDGSATWTAVAPPATEDTIQSVTWTQIDAPDALLSIESPINQETTAGAWFSGGTSGAAYLCRATVVMASGATYDCDLLLAIR